MTDAGGGWKIEDGGWRARCTSILHPPLASASVASLRFHERQLDRRGPTDATRRSRSQRRADALVRSQVPSYRDVAAGEGARAPAESLGRARNLMHCSAERTGCARSVLECGGRTQRRHRFSPAAPASKAAWRFASRRSPRTPQRAGRQPGPLPGTAGLDSCGCISRGGRASNPQPSCARISFAASGMKVPGPKTAAAPFSLRKA
jgi:hypothetical protein